MKTRACLFLQLNSPLPFAAFVAIFACLFSLHPSKAAEITRNNVVQNLDQTGAWIGGVAPGSGDVAHWTAGSRTGASTNNQMNVDLEWQGIKFESVAALVNINGAGNLTIGTAGIDLGAATVGLTLTLPTVNAHTNQTWSFNASAQLTMTSDLNIGSGTRTLSIQNPDAPSTSNKIRLNRVEGAASSVLELVNTNASTSPQAWVQIGGSTDAGIQTDLIVGNGVLTYYVTSPSLLSTANLTVASGGVFDVSTKGTAGMTQTVASLSGAGTITSNRSSAAATTLIVSNTSGTSTFSGTFADGVAPINLTKDGESILVLNGTNTTSGVFNVINGVLRLDSAGAFTSNGNLLTSGGVVELGTDNSTFTRALGSGANQVRLTGGGGFGAVGADATVNLTGTFTWGGGFFSQGGENFVLSSATSTHTVDFQTNILLGLANPTRTIDVRNGAAAVDAIISGVIQNSGTNVGSLVKIGEGTLSLTAPNTYTGTTTVNAGTLLVNNTTGSGTGAGAVTVAAGATLGGTGIITGVTTINGILSPGNSIGTLTINNNVTWNFNDAWVFELGTAGTGIGDPGVSDFLNIGGGGNFNQGTGLSFAFDFAGTGDAGWYRLISWSGTSDFSEDDFSATNLAGGLSGSFLIDSGSLYLNVIPEPSSAMLLVLGFTAVMTRRVLRRR